MLSPKSGEITKTERLLHQHGFVLEPTAEKCSEKCKLSYFSLQDGKDVFTIAYDESGNAWRKEGKTDLPDPFMEIKQYNNHGNDLDSPLKKMIGEFFGKRVEENPFSQLKSSYLHLGHDTFVWDENGGMWQISGKITFLDAEFLKIRISI